MKSSKIKMTAVLLAAAFTFAGCGEELYTMTPEEENAVVSYASKIIAKYNANQQDGEIFVTQEDLEETEKKEEPVQEELPEDDKAQDEVSIPDPQDTNASSETASNSPNSENTVTIREALNLGDISADYIDCSLCTTYEKSDVYAVDAAAGQQLLVLNVKLTNQTEQEINVDILSSKPTIQVIVNETETAAAQTTILPNDLSTYQGSLAAGASEETVLLFQIPQEIQDITSLQLRVTNNDTRFMVNL